MQPCPQPGIHRPVEGLASGSGAAGDEVRESVLLAAARVIRLQAEHYVAEQVIVADEAAEIGAAVALRALLDDKLAHVDGLPQRGIAEGRAGKVGQTGAGLEFGLAHCGKAAEIEARPVEAAGAEGWSLDRLLDLRASEIVGALGRLWLHHRAGHRDDRGEGGDRCSTHR